MGNGPTQAEKKADASVSELFAQDPFVEAVMRIEQEMHIDVVIHADLDGTHRAHLIMIGNGGDRTFGGFEHFDGYLRAIRQQRATPSPWPERTDRG
jgi:hypothetical protein